MSRLQSLDEIGSVKNPKHRAVLEAVRDTSLSMREIAKQHNISLANAYLIVRQYLPEGFSKKRTQRIKSEQRSKNSMQQCRADDLVRVVPRVKSGTQEAISSAKKSDKRASAKKDKQPSVPRFTSKEVSFTEKRSQTETSDLRSTQASRSTFTLTFGGASLAWEGESGPRQTESFCALMREFKRIFGTSL